MSFSRRLASSSGSLAFLTASRTVAAGVAHVHAAFLGLAVGGLDEFLAALAAHVRERDAHELAVDDRVEAEVGGLDGLLDGLHEAGVPRLTWIRRGSGVLMAAHSLRRIIEP